MEQPHALPGSPVHKHLDESRVEMRVASLPAYGGFHNLWAAAAREQQAALSSSLLAVPDHEPCAACAASAAATPDQQQQLQCRCWPPPLPSSAAAEAIHEASALLDGAGFSAQPLAVVAAAMPSSKADRQLNKLALAFLRRQVQPAPLPVPCPHAEAAAAGTSACTAGAAIGSSGAPKVATLRQAMLQHMLRCIGSSGAGAGAQLPERLPEPPLPEWAGCKSDCVEGGRLLLCTRAEIQQLWQQLPDSDLPPGACDALHTQVACLAAPEDAAAQPPSLSSLISGAAAAAAAAAAARASDSAAAGTGHAVLRQPLLLPEVAVPCAMLAGADAAAAATPLSWQHAVQLAAPQLEHVCGLTAADSGSWVTDSAAAISSSDKPAHSSSCAGATEAKLLAHSQLASLELPAAHGCTPQQLQLPAAIAASLLDVPGGAAAASSAHPAAQPAPQLGSVLASLAGGLLVAGGLQQLIHAGSGMAASAPTLTAGPAACQPRMLQGSGQAVGEQQHQLQDTAAPQRPASNSSAPAGEAAAAQALPADASQQQQQQEAGTGMLLELPVCAGALAAAPLRERLLLDALDVAERVAAATAGRSMSGNSVGIGWMAATQQQQQHQEPFWASAAACAMLAGASGCPATAAATLADAAGGTAGAALLEQLVCSDAQLSSDDGLPLLPVAALPDSAPTEAAAAAAAADADAFGELLAGCRYLPQPLTHLELQLDWSLMLQQPLVPSFAAGGARCSSSKQAGSASSQSVPALAGSKRGRDDCSSGGGAGAGVATWLTACSAQPGLQQLRPQLAGDGGAGAPDIREQSRACWLHVLRQELGSRTPASVLAAAQHADVPPTVAAAAAPSSSWRHRQQQPAAAMGAAAPGSMVPVSTAAGSQQRGATAAQAKLTAVAVATGPAAPAAAPAAAAKAQHASEMNFFLQIQGQAAAAAAAVSGKRTSAAARLPPSGVEASGRSAGGGSGAAAQHKRAKLASSTEAGADSHAEQENAQQQQQQRDTAELAVTGATRTGSGGAQASAQQQQPQPCELHVELSQQLLQLLCVLQDNRQVVLRGMQQPAPQLSSCELWDDSVAHQLLLSYQERAPLPASQKQQARLLAALLLLSQAAGCLLHSGVRVAHLFLQHSMQKLPSLGPLLSSSTAALAGAFQALEQLPAGAGPPATARSGSSSSIALVDHPKLPRLQELLLQLDAAQPGCKVLLVGEAKAFFTLYQALSAAGLPPVQLDRGRQLPDAPHAAAAGGAGVSDAAAAATAAWQSSVSAALAAGRCVLVTHGQLANRLLPFQLFDALVEYVPEPAAAPGGTAGGAAQLGDGAAAAGGDQQQVAHAAAGSSSSSSAGGMWRAALAAHFAGRHYVMCTSKPDLAAAAAAQAAAADAEAPAGCSQLHGASAGGTSRSAAAVAQPLAGIKRPCPGDGGSLAPAGTPAARPPLPQHHSAAAAVAAPVPPAAQAQAAAQELPVVLNRAQGSVLRQRQRLHNSLLALESQGLQLVERVLPSGPAGPAAAGALVAVLSPAACLCIWDEPRLPQAAAAALQLLAHALAGLSCAYSHVTFLLELPPQLMEHIVRQGPLLQQAATSAGVRLQLLCSSSAADTQAMVLATCAAVPRSFWDSANSSGGGSSSRRVQPPGIADVPTPAEQLLNSCVALNPLSAALLAGSGLSLRSLMDAAVAGQAGPLAAGVPPHSLQLLAAQLSASHMVVEDVDDTVAPAADQQQQHGPPAAAACWASGDNDEQERRMQQQHAASARALTAPGGYADDDDMPDAAARCYQQQWHQHQQQQQQQGAWAADDDMPLPDISLDLPAFQEHGRSAAAAAPVYGRHQSAAGAAAAAAAARAHLNQQPQQRRRQQGPGSLDLTNAEPQLRWPPRQPHMQQQHHSNQEQLSPGGMPAADMDPAGVLDAFLSGRPAGGTAGAAHHRRGVAVQQQPAFQTPARCIRPGGRCWGADAQRQQGHAAKQGEQLPSFFADDMATIDEPLEASEEQQHRRPPAAFAGRVHGQQRHAGGSRRWQQLASDSGDADGLPAATLPFSFDADELHPPQRGQQQRQTWQPPQDEAWPPQLAAAAPGGAAMLGGRAGRWPAAAGGMQGDGLLLSGGRSSGRLQQLGSWRHTGAPASPPGSLAWEGGDDDGWAAAAPQRGGAAAAGAWARGGSGWHGGPAGGAIAAHQHQQQQQHSRFQAAVPWVQTDVETDALFGGPVPARRQQPPPQLQVDWGAAQAAAGGGAACSTGSGGDSGLTIPAFMPHRKPSKQLLYRRDGTGKGKQQAKLVWSSTRRARH